MTKTQDAVDDVRHTAEEGAESAKRFLGVFKKSALDVADVARHELVDTLEVRYQSADSTFRSMRETR